MRPAAFSVAARSQATTAAEMPSLSRTNSGSTARPSASSYANTRPSPARISHLKPVSVSACRAPCAAATFDSIDDDTIVVATNGSVACRTDST